VTKPTPIKAAKQTKSLTEVLSKLDEQIRLRAYELYEQRGRQDGHELDDWLQAEGEVTQAKKKAVAA
jgi:hypothetical protein